MAKRIIIERLADFGPGDRRIVRVDGREIGVFRVGDNFYGIRNQCPHQGGPLCLGRVHPRIVADSEGQVSTLDDRAPMIACPWHAWEYDLETGQSFLGAGEPHVASYEVSVKRGESLKELDAVPAMTKGPFVAETFPVTVEEEYVVLQV